MNVETLNTICSNLTDELNSTKIIEQLNQLASNLQYMVSQPQAPQHQQAVSTLRQSIYKILQTTKINDYSPYRREVLKGMGFDKLLGNELAERIESIFKNNVITSSIAHAEITAITTQLRNLHSSITQLVNNFNSLNIKCSILEEGKSEFSVTIPRKAISQNFSQFSEEMKELRKIVDDFNELTIGSRPEIILKTIASSEYEIILEVLPITAVCIFIALEKIINIYKSLLEIRNLQKGLKRQGVPEEKIQGIEEYESQKMTDCIDECVKDLVRKFGSKIEAGRKQELSISFTKTIAKLANRIDSGFNFDVRFNDDDIEKMKTEEKTLSKKQIQDMSKTLEFVNMTDEKILSLPEEPIEGGN